MALRILRRSYQTPRHIITSIRPKGVPQPPISAIKVGICSESRTSEAKIISDDPSLQGRKLRFALTVPEEIEQAIATELDVPLQDVSSLIHYKAYDRHCPQ